jgi:hypothetical protein
MHAGAAVRVITTNGRTPMFVAAEKGLGEMIRIMIEDCNVCITLLSSGSAAFSPNREDYQDLFFSLTLSFSTCCRSM